MPRHDSPPFDDSTLSLGSDLAAALIARYWDDFEAGRIRSYHGRPPRYVPGDRWATRDRWIAAAQRCLDASTYLLGAYEILLAEGLTEYTASALALVQAWHDTSGHDPDRFCRLLAHLPDGHLRREYLSNQDADEILADSESRTALLAVGDAHTCELVSERIVRDLSTPALDEAWVRHMVLARLAELGPRCREYLPAAPMARAKRICVEGLSAERASSGEDADDWFRRNTAYVAWRVGWHDVLRDLAEDPWYWSGAFHLDSENDTLLTWSLLLSSNRLKARALDVMRRPFDGLDGAIAWVRLHAPPLQDLTTTHASS